MIEKTSAGEEVEKLEFVYIAGGNVNCERWSALQKIRRRITM